MSESADLSQGKIQLNPRYRLQWEDAQQCHVLLYPEGLIKLNDSATEILRRCREPISQEQLVQDLQQAFPQAEGLEHDVGEFLDHAWEQEWIVQSRG